MTIVVRKPVLLIAFILVIGTLDLTLTLIALRGGWLIEQNPIADHILSFWGGWGLICFKTTATSTACMTIWVAIKKGWPEHRGLLTVAISSIVVMQLFLLSHWTQCLIQFL